MASVNGFVHSRSKGSRLTTKEKKVLSRIARSHRQAGVKAVMGEFLDQTGVPISETTARVYLRKLNSQKNPDRESDSEPAAGDVPKIGDYVAETGAVRSDDVDDLDFASMPLVGLLGVMKVAGCGGAKYGRYNYMKGFPAHKTIGHAVVHIIRWLCGDRSEDHLSKAAWGLMVANQTAALQPELAEPHVLGAGAVLTEAVLAEMDKGKPERDARRQAGEFEELFYWGLKDIPAVQEILKAREQAAKQSSP